METDTWSLKNIVTGEIHCISKSVFKVGRNVNANLTSLTSSLSRNHAIFSILIDGLLYLQDNNSCNGTFVNNQKIQPMEMKLVKEGDIIGFGCCEELCKDQNLERPPLIFTVLKKSNEPPTNVCKQEAEERVQEIKNEFSIISDCIIISDGEDDDNLFSNSQIYKISEKIKSEQQTVNESGDPYYNIKQELKNLDCYDNNEFVVDLTEEDDCFERTSDLLHILESPVHKLSETVTNERNDLPPNCFDESVFNNDEGSPKPESSKSKKESDNVGKAKWNVKRKSTVSGPHVKKKIKNSLLESTYDKKSIKKEFDKRSTSKNPEKKKIDGENKIVLLEQRRRRLKEIAHNNDGLRNIKTKTVKHVAKVKSSGSRGTFLLEECSKARKDVDSKDASPSGSSRSRKKRIETRTADREIQDTTITSNFSPKNDTERSEDPTRSVPDPPPDPQRPDSTCVENRSGMIWRNASNVSNALPRHVQKNVTIDDVICKIVHWSVKWLMEQNNIDRSPPVNGETQPKKVPLSFGSFSEYADTVGALTTLELWQYVYQTLYNRDEERSPIRIFLNHKRIVGNLMYLDCECYMTEQDVKNNVIPRTDNFVLIELKLKDSTNSYMYTGFAYIKFCKRTYLRENSKIDSNIAALCSGIPNVNVTFSMITRNLPNKTIMGKQIIMKVIANISTSLRLLKSIKYLELSPLCKHILFPKIEDFITSPKEQRLTVELNLNKEQKEIVSDVCDLCLGNDPKLYLIKGPPGTGKSTIIVNIVLRIILSSVKDSTREPLILLTAPSNAAVDGLVLKLAEMRQRLSETQRRHMKMVRLGPESSISTNVNKFKLSSLAGNHLLKEHKLTGSDKYKDALSSGTDTDRFLRNHFGHTYHYEMKCAEDALLFGSNVICTTLSSCVGPRMLEAKRRDKLKFSCCIIDEAAQCTEPESLLPVQLGIDRIVLVGDPQQLPAVVCNKEAQRLGYGRSLFARIDENFKNTANNPVKMLCDQYRMNHEICEYPSKTFYDGKLKSFPMHVNGITPELKHYLLFNILGSEKEDDSPYVNSQEVGLICNLLETLKKYVQVTCKYTIGIITPYKAQKENLSKQISDIKFNRNVSMTVNTVDSFQGMENDIIIISCVRSAPNNFLQNEQRLNVALTRARQALYIIGNYSLFKHCQPLYDLREDAKKRRLCIDIKNFSKNIDFSKYIFQT